jgi:hypothetical protein
VETNGRAAVLGAGEPWFERGPDPVYAESIADEPLREAGGPGTAEGVDLHGLRRRADHAMRTR